MIQESELNKVTIPNEVLLKSKDEIIDNLISTYKDEELALRALNQYMKTNDGYKDKLNAVKEDLKKVIESKKESKASMTPKEEYKKIITEFNNMVRPSRMAEPSEYLSKRNAVKDEEITQLIINGIHPNVLYSRRMWRYETKNGDRIVFELMGIDKKGGNNDQVLVVPKQVVRLEDGRQVIRNGEILKMPAERFLSIIKSPLNKDVYDYVMRGESENPDDWYEEFNAAKNHMRNAFNRWVEQVKKFYDVEDLDTVALQKVYMLTKEGYSIPEAIKRYRANPKLKIKDSVIDEAGKMDYEKDPKLLRKILPQLNIDPNFIDMPFTVIDDNENLPPEDRKAPEKYTIAGVDKGPVENIKNVYLRDWDKGGRAIAWQLEDVLSVVNKEENQNPTIDLWDKASTITKQNKSINSGTTGKFMDLTKNQIIAALQYVQSHDTEKLFDGIDLVQHFLDQKSYDTRNKLIDKALRMVDPRYSIRVLPSQYGYNGIGYKIFIPAWDNPNTKPSSSGYKFKNPYKAVMNDWY